MIQTKKSDAAQAAPAQKVKVLSQRLGDIQLKDKQVLRYQEILELDADLAASLVKSFPGELRVI